MYKAFAPGDELTHTNKTPAYIESKSLAKGSENNHKIDTKEKQVTYKYSLRNAITQEGRLF